MNLAQDFVALRDFVRERRTGEYSRLSKTPLEERQRTSESAFMKYPGYSAQGLAAA